MAAGVRRPRGEVVRRAQDARPVPRRPRRRARGVGARRLQVGRARLRPVEPHLLFVVAERDRVVRARPRRRRDEPGCVHGGPVDRWDRRHRVGGLERQPNWDREHVCVVVFGRRTVGRRHPERKRFPSRRPRDAAGPPRPPHRRVRRLRRLAGLPERPRGRPVLLDPRDLAAGDHGDSGRAGEFGARRILQRRPHSVHSRRRGAAHGRDEREPRLPRDRPGAGLPRHRRIRRRGPASAIGHGDGGNLRLDLPRRRRARDRRDGNLRSRARPASRRVERAVRRHVGLYGRMDTVRGRLLSRKEFSDAAKPESPSRAQRAHVQHADALRPIRGARVSGRRNPRPRGVPARGRRRDHARLREREQGVTPLHRERSGVGRTLRFPLCRRRQPVPLRPAGAAPRHGRLERAAHTGPERCAGRRRRWRAAGVQRHLRDRERMAVRQPRACGVPRTRTAFGGVRGPRGDGRVHRASDDARARRGLRERSPAPGTRGVDRDVPPHRSHAPNRFGGGRGRHPGPRPNDAGHERAVPGRCRDSVGGRA